MFRRFLRRLTESDEIRLAEEVRTWSASVPGTVRIAECPSREKVKVAGIVRRITIQPVEGFEALQAVIYDGTGEVAVVWLGRRSIPGLFLGSKLILEGVLSADKNGVRKMVNPTFEFS